MYIQRDFYLSEEDDFVLNVSPMLLKFDESVPQFSEDGILVGWRIQGRYE